MKQYPDRRKIEVQNMFQTVEDTYYLNNETDLVYSPDDGGWYIHDYKNDRASIVYSTKGKACEAYIADSLEWETK